MTAYKETYIPAKEDYVPHKMHVPDHSAYSGTMGEINLGIHNVKVPSEIDTYLEGTTFADPNKWLKEYEATVSVPYKYNEDKTLAEMKEYIDNTYKAHYQTDSDLQCVDVWIALGDSLSTFRNTIMKYLWRVGKKGEYIEDHISDVKKAMHYCMFMLYVLEQENKKNIKSKI